MRISAVTSTLLFRGTAARPRQIVQVTVVNDTAAEAAPATVTVAGAGLATPEPAAVPALPPGGEHVAEVAIEAAAALGAGTSRPVTVIAQSPAGPALVGDGQGHVLRPGPLQRGRRGRRPVARCAGSPPECQNGLGAATIPEGHDDHDLRQRRKPAG